MRVLVVEDDEDLAASIAHGLEVAGFAVDLEHTGDGGLWRAGDGEYDAIVLDVMLPGLDGYALCRKVRALGVPVPILMLTARDGEMDEVQALDTGADDYLAKPFSYPVLLARLRALIRRGARERPVELRAGDLRLDPAARRVWRAQDELRLSNRQFALLEFLLRRAGQVQSKANILDHVWDFAFDGDPNIVEVYIHNLRKKIDTPYGRNAIQTIRHAGYRLASDGG